MTISHFEMARYYVSSATARGKHHLVTPGERSRNRLYVSALCPAPVRRTDVLTVDLPRVPGGLRTVEVWRRVFGDALCDHCVQASIRQTSAVR